MTQSLKQIVSKSCDDCPFNNDGCFCNLMDDYSGAHITNNYNKSPPDWCKLRKNVI